LRTNEGRGDYFTVADEPATEPQAFKLANKAGSHTVVGALLVLLIAGVGVGGVRKLQTGRRVR